MYYFVYSQQQYSKQEIAYKKIGKTYIPGKVTVNGKIQLYTSITSDIKTTKTLFGDVKIVAMTESLSTMHYTKPSANSARRPV